MHFRSLVQLNAFVLVVIRACHETVKRSNVIIRLMSMQNLDE